jgi:DNA-binding IclR family transcriptional regulator
VNTDGDEPRYAVKATEKSFRIVEALREMDGATITELADHLGLSKSAVHKHLQTLKRHRYVIQEDNEYSLALRFLEFGIFVQERRPIYRVAGPEVENLAQITGEFAGLVVEEQGYGVCLYGSSGERTTDISMREGAQISLRESASGRAILAHLPEARCRDILANRGIELDDELKRELQKIRDRGLAFTRDDQGNDVQSVAAPVLDTDRVPVGAICVVGSSDRLSGKRLKEDVSGLVISTAQSVENDYVTAVANRP